MEKVYVVYYYCGEINPHGEPCRSVVRIFKTEKEAKLFVVFNNFIEDCVFSSNGYDYEEVELDEYNLDDSWEILIKEIKAQIDEFGKGERIKNEIKKIIDFMPEKYKKEILLHLL